MKNIRNMQIIIVMGLCFVIFIFTMAFSIKSKELLNESKKITLKRSNVYFEKLSAVMIGKSSYKMPELNVKSFNSFQVILREPGDKVIFRFRLVNKGDNSCIISKIKEKIHCNQDSLNKYKEVCNSLKYDLTYEDGVSVMVGDTLTDNSSKNVKLTIEYPTNISNSMTSSIIVLGDYFGISVKDK